MLKKSFLNKSIIFLSPLITLLILFTVYMVKGIYPFGSRSVAYYDMVQSLLPLYYNTWDVLHGLKSAFFDWHSGLGVTTVDTFGNFILNPYNLFFFFVKRNNLVNSMSYFLALKLSFAAFFASLYFIRKYKTVPGFLNVIFGVSYAFCAFTLQYYSNIQFLDIASLFPLLVYGHDLLIENKNNKLYSIVLTISMMSNIYLAFMECVYIVIRTFLIVLKKDKNERYSVSFRLSVASVISFMLSVVFVFPEVYVLLSSARNEVGDSSSGYIAILKTVYPLYGNSNIKFMLYGTECALAILIYTVIKNWGFLKKIYYDFLLVLLLIIPMFVEGTNLLWHLGSYAQFPMRFAYMLSFECLIVVAKHFENTNMIGDGERNSLINKVFGIVSVSLLPVLIVVLFEYVKGFKEYGICNPNSYEPTFLVLLLSFVCIFFSLLSNHKKISKIEVAVVLMIEATLGAYGFIGPEKDLYAECSRELLESTISTESYISSDSCIRYKNIGSGLITNYSFVNGSDSVSNWTWGANSDLLALRYCLGYSTAYTRLLDEGGTVFSDELFGVNKVISNINLNPSLYSLDYSDDGLYYYSSNYTIPFARVISSIPASSDAVDFFEYQNDLFTELTGIHEDLIETEYYYFDESAYNELGDIHIDLDVVGNKTLYVYASGNRYEIVINDEVLSVPYLKYRENIAYPAPFSNGLFECGTYSDETVDFDMYIIQNSEDYNSAGYNCAIIGLMDMDLLRRGNEVLSSGNVYSVEFNKNRLWVEGTSETDGYIMLPLAYNDGFKCTLNGTEVPIMSGLENSLVFVPLSAGDYKLTISYYPKGMAGGLIITLAGVLALFISFMLRKRDLKLSDTRLVFVEKASYYMLSCLALCIFAFMYFIPIIFNIFIRFFGF